MQNRTIVLDLEMTGIYVGEGHRIVEVAALEMIGDRPTGRVFHSYVNPQRPVPPETTAIHGLTGEFLADKPVFPAIAHPLREFIGDSPIIITCRTDPGGYTGDIAFLNSEMENAGLPGFPENQWRNVRRWGEALFGDEGARLNNMLDHYGIDRKGRGGKTGHGALVDAELLARLYPFLKRDYQGLINGFSGVRPNPVI